MKFSNNMIAAAIIMLILVGCDSSAMKDGTTDLTLNLSPFVHGIPLSTDSGTTYDANGVPISFESFRIYLSEITLINTNNQAETISPSPITVPAKNSENEDVTHLVEEQVILAKQDAGINSYDLGTWPSGNYKEIRFKVGVGGMTNRIDPSQVPADHSLAKQTDYNNHWNWNAGYLYLRMDGKIDTDADAVPDEKWAVHLGTERFLREVKLEGDFKLENDQQATIDINIDYGELLKNVDLSDPDQRICHTMNNLPVANAVAGQIESAFTLR